MTAKNGGDMWRMAKAAHSWKKRYLNWQIFYDIYFWDKLKEIFQLNK